MHDYAVLKLKDLCRRGLPDAVRVWSVLAIHGTLRPKEICQLTGMYKTNLARVMRRMEEMGYLKREGKMPSRLVSLRLQLLPTKAGEKSVALPVELLLGGTLKPTKGTSSRARVVGRKVA